MSGKIKLLISASAVLLFAIATILFGGHAQALSGNDFNPGRIIDDAVFYNSGAMSAPQIQNFLNSKVPSCDTNGSQKATAFGYPDLTRAQYAKKMYDEKIGTNWQRWHQPPYTCLKDRQQNTPQMEAASGLCEGVQARSNRTAAQIINDVAKACDLNPQVLLVLLEKEQSLITDTWPLNEQYEKATGFDCPDTAPCDPQFSGFFYQTYYAARQFKVYKKYPTDYNYIAKRNNNIYWNPDLSRCGSSSVYIQNQATAALYIYTPYQPNKAALDNLYGTGNSCSSYGNRNFWRLFNDWFGSTIINESVKYTIYSSVTDKTGMTASFGVSLSKKPTSDVTIQYGITSPSSAAFIGSSKVTIKPSTWNSPELNKITVRGLNNTSQVGNIDYTVRASRPVTSDRAFSILGGDMVGHVTMINQDTASSRPVYQLYSSALDKHFYTASIYEKADKISDGFSDRGVAFYYCSAGDVTLQSMLKTNSEQRLEIKDSTQYKSLLNASFSDSSTAFTVSSKGTVPVYRHYKAATDHSFYSISPSEATSQGYVSQGVAFYSCDQASIPVYRLYKPSTGTQFYSISSTMRDDVRYNGGYRYENVSYYIKEGGTVPVYRLYKPSTGTHFYTLSESERDQVAREGGYRSEGIAYYLQEGGTVPVYRLYKPSTGRHYYTTSISDRDYVAKNGGYIYQGISMYITN